MINLVSGASRLMANPATPGVEATGPGAGIPGFGAPANAGQADGPSFTQVMASMGAEVVGNLRNAEVQSFKAIAGETSTREVVDALMAAEQSLQTAIAIRDKLVTAYMEITRMQI